MFSVPVRRGRMPYPKCSFAEKPVRWKISAKIGGRRVKLPDHSMFVAFAPKDNPKIAIAVVVENGVWGARWAAPIASLMMEHYIVGGPVDELRAALEKRMIEGSLEDTYKLYDSMDNPKKATR